MPVGRKPNISQTISNVAKDAVHTSKDAHELRKAQSILLPALFSLDLVATGIVIGRSKASVCRLQAEFRAEYAGTYIAPKKRGGRRRQNMSFEQEAQLLEPFFQKAREGKPFVVADIRKAYETAIGKKVPASTVYRILARHGWRPLRADRSKDQG
jgi:transposase